MRTLGGDTPKKTLADDEYGLATMVVAIADTLSKRIALNGYVIGVEERWGSGKSTFVNFVAERLERSYPSHCVIRFEPWLIGDKSALISTFFGQLAREIKKIKKNTRPFWRIDIWLFGGATRIVRDLLTYGRYVGALSAPVGAFAGVDPSGATAMAAAGLKTLGFLSSWRTTPPTLHELKIRLSNEIATLEYEELPIRFTVIIDDMDRLEPNESLEILRLVRSVGDFPSISYVRCFDIDK